MSLLVPNVVENDWALQLAEKVEWGVLKHAPA